MASIIGLDRVNRRIRELSKQHLSSPNEAKGESVIVGYTANYALHIHENIEMFWQGMPRDPRKWPGIKHQKNPRPREINPKGLYWDPQGKGQAKFLEQPARELNNAGTLGMIVFNAMKRGATLQQALFLAGGRIQRESMKLVPVDTGNLKASAFTRKE